MPDVISCSKAQLAETTEQREFYRDNQSSTSEIKSKIALESKG